MKLDRDWYNHLDRISQRYAQLRRHFTSFSKSAVELLDSKPPAKELSIRPGPGEECISLSFAGTALRFQFLVEATPTDEALRGRVFVTRVAPSLTGTPDVIGSFTFNYQGFVDMDANDGADKRGIEDNASAIVLHFLDQALGKPLPGAN